jgi:hypothetical protein
MDPKAVLPKRLVNYIHETGVRALDNLADNASGGQPGPLQTLINDWKGMSKDDKEQFVDRVAEAVIAVIAASALLPAAAKLGKKAARSARKAIKRQKKVLKKNATATKKDKEKKKAKSPKAA